MQNERIARLTTAVYALKPPGPGVEFTLPEIHIDGTDVLSAVVGAYIGYTLGDKLGYQAGKIYVNVSRFFYKDPLDSLDVAVFIKFAVQALSPIVCAGLFQEVVETTIQLMNNVN